MKKFVNFLAATCFLLLAFVLASCSNESGVEVTMLSNVTTKSIELNFTFGANDHLTNGDAVPHVKKYSYSETNEDNVGDYLNQDIQLSFENIYTSASCTFESLEINTKYVFRLYVTFNSNEELKGTWVISTKTGVATDITNKSELMDIKNDPTGSYVLKNDIDLEGEKISSIFDSSNEFTGTFDGAGYKIKNFRFYSDNNGLFAFTDGATIKNLTLDGTLEGEESVNAEYTSSKSSSSIGFIAGKAVDTKFENVVVNNASMEINAAASADLKVGGLVGLANGCQFINCQANNVTIKYTRLRNKVCTGLFAGSITGLIKTKDMDKFFAAKNCSASGLLEGTLFYPSSEGYAYCGGFAGDISANEAIVDCYAISTISLYRNETSSDDNKFTLSVGGFTGGLKLGSSLLIKQCAAISDILVQAAGRDSALEEDAINASLLCTKYACVGGFIGEASESINKISNSVYAKLEKGITVKALIEKTNDDQTTKTVIYKDNVVGKGYIASKFVNVLCHNDNAFDKALLQEFVLNAVKDYLA